MAKRSWTRRRDSAISSSASALVASPAFSMKFACRSETSAPPIRSPFSPHASISAPAPGPEPGLLKTLPKVQFRRRLGRLPLREQLGDLGADLSAGRGDSGNRTPRRRLRVRARSGGRPGRGPRGRPSGYLRPDDERIEQDGAPVAAVGAGVHANAAAGRAGDRGGELEPAEPGVAPRWRQTAFFGASAGDEDLSLDAHRCQVALEPEDEGIDALVGSERFDPSPTGSTATPSAAAQATASSSSARVELEEALDWAARRGRRGEPVGLGSNLLVADDRRRRARPPARRRAGRGRVEGEIARRRRRHDARRLPSSRARRRARRHRVRLRDPRHGRRRRADERRRLRQRLERRPGRGARRLRGRDAAPAPAELGLAYRHSALAPGEVVARGAVPARAAPARAIRAEVGELLAQRKATQPTTKRTFGSVFKNPGGGPGAGRAARVLRPEGLPDRRRERSPSGTRTSSRTPAARRPPTRSR